MTDPALTVYHDGSCPLCRLEIGHYRRQRGADTIRFVDVSDEAADLGPDLSHRAAMGRFHVRFPSGELHSGAAAFIAIWRQLPMWRPLAFAARTPALEIGYRAFSPIRPRLARLVSRLGLA